MITASTGTMGSGAPTLSSPWLGPRRSSISNPLSQVVEHSSRMPQQRTPIGGHLNTMWCAVEHRYAKRVLQSSDSLRNGGL